jgi:hypothetical protein
MPEASHRPRLPGSSMSLRPPRSLSTSLQSDTGWSVLDYELAQQKAQTLGNLGHQVEQALTKLRAFDAQGDASARPAERSDLLDEAADRVWAFMIQRELSGLRCWETVVRDFGIPREVLNRMGRVSRSAGR